MRQLQSDTLSSPFHRKVLYSLRKTARLAPLCFAVHLLAELCSATIHAVRFALPVISHVHLHKRWVEREREITE